MSIRQYSGSDKVRRTGVQTSPTAAVALCRSCDAFKVAGECPNCDGGA